MKRISILLCVVAAGCASTAPVPENLKPGGNESLALIVPAKGVQIYECRAGKWVFVAPEAELLDRAGRNIGSHYAGPHWESADGSKTVGSEGAFSKVTSIQRVATVGGVAPAGACSQPGTQARIAYTADYYFFTSK